MVKVENISLLFASLYRPCNNTKYEKMNVNEEYFFEEMEKLTNDNADFPKIYCGDFNLHFEKFDKFKTSRGKKLARPEWRRFLNFSRF